MRMKKLITACLLSALVASYTSIPILAVNDADETDMVDVSQGVEQSSIVEDESSNPFEYIDPFEESSEETSEAEDSEVSSEDSEQESSEQVSDEDEQVSDEESTESSEQEVSEESKSEQSSEISKEESSGDESSKPEKAENEISYVVGFGCDILSNTATDSRIDFSNVKMSIVAADKKTVIKRYDMYEILSYQHVTRTFGDTVKFPSWQEGDVYYLHFENLPRIYKSRTYDIPMKCERVEYTVQGEAFTELTGVNTGFTLSLLDNLNDFNILLTAYDLNYQPVPNAVFNVDIYIANTENLIYTTKLQVEDGCGFAFAPWELFEDELGADTEYTVLLSSQSIANESLFTGTTTFPFYKHTVNIYSMYADTSLSDILKDSDGNQIKDYVDVPIHTTYRDNYDMELFQDSDIVVSLYSGETCVESLSLNKQEPSNHVYLNEGDRFTLKLRSFDYATQYNSTLIVNKDVNVAISATPQLSLTIINEDEGVRRNAHFKIAGTDKEYNEPAHKFAVNADMSYTVTNLDTQEVYYVNIEHNKETVLNIASGAVDQNGYIPSDLDEIDRGNTNNDVPELSDTTDYAVTNVPKTGDMIVGVTLSLFGVTGLSYLGYVYYKRKGKKHHEVKK